MARKSVTGENGGALGCLLMPLPLLVILFSGNLDAAIITFMVELLVIGAVVYLGNSSGHNTRLHNTTSLQERAYRLEREFPTQEAERRVRQMVYDRDVSKPTPRFLSVAPNTRLTGYGDKPTMNEIALMSGEKFEQFLKGVFEKQGYTVVTTPKSGDYGADLVLHKGSSKVVVQAKRWSGKVGNKAVQEAASAMPVYGADKAIVVTNSIFTQNAKRQAAACAVELWDGEKLNNIVSRML